MNITTLKDNTVEQLQDLIRINIDSYEGFELVADEAEDPQMVSLFKKYAADRKEYARELKNLVWVNGEEPDDDGSWKAKCHRWWIKARNLLTPDDLPTLLSEAERGEDEIKELYEEVMKNTIGTPIHPTLEKQYKGVKDGHDTIRDMRDRVKAEK